jgi:hypothetical protein
VAEEHEQADVAFPRVESAPLVLAVGFEIEGDAGGVLEVEGNPVEVGAGGAKDSP